MGSYTVALTGDAILNTRVSSCADSRVLQLVDVLRSANVTHTHLEIPLHGFEEHEVFPSAEGALSWMSGPVSTVEELKWCGIDLVSMASNHSLDYSYGGLHSTLAALDRFRVPHAGAGKDLASARLPAFLDTAHGRIALVSAVSSFPTFARAGHARRDVRGRPGVNGLRFYHVVDPATADELGDLHRRLGNWVTYVGDEFTVNPPGLHNTLQRFKVDPTVSGISTACDEDDLAEILAALRYASAVSDFVIAHLHSHEWDAKDGRMCTSPAFVEEFARASVRCGAAAVIVQGSHAPIRGIEIYQGAPIFYDPGPLFRLGRRDKQPQDFYTRWGNGPDARSASAGILEAFAAREGALGSSARTHDVRSPLEGVSHDPGFFIPVCQVDSENHRVTRVTLYPASWMTTPRAATGFPMTAPSGTAEATLDLVASLSGSYGTRVHIQGNAATIDLGQARV
jgi:Bacterial capsule synthesis protein PGA_cap